MEPASGAAAVVKGKRWFWITAVLILGLDLFTKQWAFGVLGVDAGRYETLDEFRASYHPQRPLLGDRVRLVAMLNPGMMWGTFASFSKILLVLRFVAVLVVLYLVTGLEPGRSAGQVALGAILGGALGNIHDSVRFLGVRDFLEVDLDVWMCDPFPAFNVADSAICVGVALLALGLWRTSREGTIAASVQQASERREAEEAGG